MQAAAHALSKAFAALSDRRHSRRELVSECVVAAIDTLPASADVLCVRGMVSEMFMPGIGCLVALLFHRGSLLLQRALRVL